jgi:hypothetical protein
MNRDTSHEHTTKKVIYTPLCSPYSHNFLYLFHRALHPPSTCLRDNLSHLRLSYLSDYYYVISLVTLDLG